MSAPYCRHPCVNKFGEDFPENHITSSAFEITSPQGIDLSERYLNESSVEVDFEHSIQTNDKLSKGQNFLLFCKSSLQVEN